GRGIMLGGNSGTVDVAAGQTVIAPVYIAGQGSLIKMGAGTLVLAGFGASPGGTRSNYIGTNLVNEGTLSYSALNGLSTIPTALVHNYWTLSNGATLQLDLTSTGSFFFGASTLGIRIAGGGNISVTGGNNWIYNSVISGSGDLTKTGTGTLTLGG